MTDDQTLFSLFHRIHCDDVDTETLHLLGRTYRKVERESNMKGHQVYRPPFAFPRNVAYAAVACKEENRAVLCQRGGVHPEGLDRVVLGCREETLRREYADAVPWFRNLVTIANGLREIVCLL